MPIIWLPNIALFLALAENLANISILTSTKDSPEEPTLAYPDTWMVRDYREQPYYSLRILDFKPPILARHVAVIGGHAGLALAEVEIYGMFGKSKICIHVFFWIRLKKKEIKNGISKVKIYLSQI